MSAVLDQSSVRVVFDASVGSAGASRRFDLLSALLKSGHAVTCPASDGAVAPHDESDVLVLGEGGSNGSEDRAEGGADSRMTVRYRDVTSMDAEAVVELVSEVVSDAGAYRPGEWKPWFPVIDYDRCTDCMQCLSFCLFDVYGVDEAQHIEVRNQDKCKTNCPACSRVCPEVAILFPKYKNGPINGAEVDQTDLEHEKMKTDISALLGGDIYSMLRDRHKRAESRFSKERDESKALKERIKCLKKLGEQFDIPEEVLMSLPSLDEIRENAARAFDDQSNPGRQNG